MHRALGPAVGVGTCAMFVVGAVVVGCAMSSPADVSPDLLTGLPGVDAAYDPQAVPGAEGGSPPDASGSDPDASGKKTFGPDAAPVDAAPPIPVPLAGELLITEVMYTTFTPEPASEWIEVYSAATVVRSLSGLTIKDGGGRTAVIGAGVTIAPGAYVVLARSKAGAIAAKVPAGVIAYEYGAGLPDSAGVQLANGATGGVSVLNGAAAISSAPYGGWFSQSGGSSIQLKALDPSTTATKAGWCLSLNAWTAGSEKGTPGAAGDCP